MLLKKDLIATLIATLAFLATFLAEYFHLAPRVIGVSVGFLAIFCGNFLGKRQTMLYMLILTTLAALFLNPLALLKYLLVYLLMPILIVFWNNGFFYKVLILFMGSGGVFLYLQIYLKYFNFIYLLNYKINSIGFIMPISVIGATVYYFILTYGWDYIKKNIPDNFLNYL
ncbi:hypothetical protein ciss_06520 [Carboxydothermus islandicus]|uniref:Uncharacterized protein n=1 Tax=Carboxydothermus islandicus TaxID=661089 RepID=A0A1L8D0Q6_9THEO|nr:hypothetical protein [Carboxydothermus islandicus]GAV24719.1 hypothetical protein ciss_06520 [Carboxydothermus islandicus]